jgi:pilus assembly protein Flp/PilA
MKSPRKRCVILQLNHNPGTPSMKLALAHVVNFLKREDGPTAVEYAVMLALIIVVCIAAVTAIGGSANQTFSRVGSAIKPS